MFLSGLEIDFSSIRLRRRSSPCSGATDIPRGSGRAAAALAADANPLIVSLIVFGGVLLLAFLFAFMLSAAGFANDPYLLTLIIATISLGVVLPVLKENRLLGTPLVKRYCSSLSFLTW